MSNKYAYSYDREDYVGAYDTVEEAIADAVQKAEGLSSPPQTIYIGTIAEADPQATDHAERIVESMNRRAHVDIGDSAAKYLKNVSREQVQELDNAIAQTILAWLKKNDLMPNFVRIRGIQEYPVPTPTARAEGADGNEVNGIGTPDPWNDLTGL